MKYGVYLNQPGLKSTHGSVWQYGIFWNRVQHIVLYNNWNTSMLFFLFLPSLSLFHTFTYTLPYLGTLQALCGCCLFSAGGRKARKWHPMRWSALVGSISNDYFTSLLHQFICKLCRNIFSGHFASQWFILTLLCTLWALTNERFIMWKTTDNPLVNYQWFVFTTGFVCRSVLLPAKQGSTVSHPGLVSASPDETQCTVKKEIKTRVTSRGKFVQIHEVW